MGRSQSRCRNWSVGFLFWITSFCASLQWSHYPTTAFFTRAVFDYLQETVVRADEHQTTIGGNAPCAPPRFRHQHSVDHYHMFLSLSSSQTI
ncbi:hypothetical protein DFJ58DRAFT_771900 [Suillus subalutaceus]|uniref:uncharacterized protein n=1 Tax=Suillus subalutaceus TaxID=48586 RepID=UPI001B878048|nr:uncharacterized protein DFJ58DRAFT_771900 [Suillus subalutaceus]KAG1864991.1 hypothetical protein DFJ58DRAFT_771900 [Suillus subalutaceus]